MSVMGIKHLQKPGLDKGRELGREMESPLALLAESVWTFFCCCLHFSKRSGPGEGWSSLKIIGRNSEPQIKKNF